MGAHGRGRPLAPLAARAARRPGHGGPARGDAGAARGARQRRRGGRPMSLRLDEVAPHGRRRGLDRHPLARPRGRPALRAARADAGRQDLADAADGRARPAELGPHPGRRRRRHRPVGAQAQRRHGLPAVHQLPDAHRLRQHRLALAAAGRAARPRSTARCARPRGCCTSTTCSTGCRRSCRAASSSGSRSPAPWSSDASLLLLDEPLVNLDYKLREELRAELRDLFARQRTTVVYATTEPLEALIMGGEVIVMDEGRVLQHGPTVAGLPPAGLAARRARSTATRR